MAGHSHWKSIKHRKAAVDAKRGKMFSKLAKNITVAARTGGGDPADNLRLRYAIEAARAESMPRDSIERAVKKGTGELEGAALEELIYEGIGPGGVSIMLDLLTDNRNRTSSEIRSLIEHHGGTLGKSGSVAWKFDRKGVVRFSRSLTPEDELLEAAIEAGAENVSSDGDEYVVTTQPADFDAVRSALQKFLESKKPKSDRRSRGDDDDQKPVLGNCSIERVPQNTVPIDAGKASALLELLEGLEEHEDVQQVACDVEMPEEALEENQGG